jgi:hypothetical protein
MVRAPAKSLQMLPQERRRRLQLAAFAVMAGLAPDPRQKVSRI